MSAGLFWPKYGIIIIKNKDMTSLCLCFLSFVFTNSDWSDDYERPSIACIEPRGGSRS